MTSEVDHISLDEFSFTLDVGSRTIHVKAPLSKDFNFDSTIFLATHIAYLHKRIRNLESRLQVIEGPLGTCCCKKCEANHPEDCLFH